MKKKEAARLSNSDKLLRFIKTKWYWIFFVGITIVGMIIRFYNIESVQGFGWDQARDAWTVRDILLGKFTLIGPRTGIGHFHLGPVYYYFLAPFFYLFHLDPMASNYFNMLANLFNFIVIFLVGKKLLRLESALFITFVYAVSAYLIQMNRIPWNVTMVPGFSALIFYGLYKTATGHYRWIAVINLLAGFFINLHLSAVFFPPIIILSFLFSPHKKKLLLWYLVSLPLYGVWYLPNVFSESVSQTGDYFKIRDFFHDYVMNFHLQFFFHRFPDGLIQYSALIHNRYLDVLRYIIPAVFFLTIFLFEKDKEKKIVGYVCLLFLLVPIIGFTIYSGPISDYYFLLTMPVVLYSIAYLQERAVLLNPKLILPILCLVCLLYAFSNITEAFPRAKEGSLADSKKQAMERVKERNGIPYNEGDIKSYLYEIGIHPL